MFLHCVNLNYELNNLNIMWNGLWILLCSAEEFSYFHCIWRLTLLGLNCKFCLPGGSSNFSLVVLFLAWLLLLYPSQVIVQGNFWISNWVCLQNWGFSPLSHFFPMITVHIPVTVITLNSVIWLFKSEQLWFSSRVLSILYKTDFSLTSG